MAWATKCDRCGKCFDFHEETSAFAFLIRLKDNTYNIDGDEFDLCPDCVQDLWDWVENKTDVEDGEDAEYNN